MLYTVVHKNVALNFLQQLRLKILTNFVNFCTTLNINVKTRFAILHGSMYDEVRRFGTLRCTILFLVNYYPVINRRQHYALLFVFCNFPGNFMNS